MKKFVFAGLLVGLSCTGCAQVRIGLKFSPAISISGVRGEGVFDGAENDGAGIRYVAGPVFDIFFQDNYAFSTGLWFTTRRSAVTYPTGFAGEPAGNKSHYDLQYLQVPVSLKLYTNEVAPDLRVYFQLGGTIDVKLAERARQRSNNFLYYLSEEQDRRAYSPVDVGLLLAVGAELFMGQNTAVFGGVSFNRGFLNPIGRVDYNGSRVNNDLDLSNNLIGIDVGIKF